MKATTAVAAGIGVALVLTMGWLLRSRSTDTSDSTSVAEPTSQSISNCDVAAEASSSDSRREELIPLSNQVDRVVESAASTRTESITVAVVNESGDPVPGALVEQFARDGDVHHLHRTETTSADGSCKIESLAGEQVLVASLGHERSTPWQGTARERVRLTLRPTFELSGSVSFPLLTGDGRSAPRLTIAGQARNLWRTLQVIPQVASGALGTLELPCMDVDRYRVRLEGGGLVPAEAFLDPPPAGARRVVTLASELGVGVTFRVRDQEDEPIDGAVVKVKWQSPDRPDHWNQTEAHTDASGFVTVAGIPPGTMMHETRAAGFVSKHSGLEPTSPGENSFIRVELDPAGRLTGRCTRGGVPVEDFEVLVWNEIGAIPQSHPFLDREDGRFEIDSVPLGTFWVTANTPDHPGGEPLTTSCGPDGHAEVEIDLPELVLGRGRVVDARTGEPIPEAAIQVFVPASPIPIARWGLPVPVESDGTFQIAAFLPGSNPVRALAPGYSNRIATAESIGGVVDYGTVGLERTQDLEIVLERSDPSIDVRVSGRGVQILDEHRFGSDGRLVYENVSAGAYALYFVTGDYESTTVEVELAPGQDWVVRERVDGPGHLSVECRLPDGRPYGGRFQTYTTYLSSQDMRHERRALSDSGIARTEGIDARSVSVRVADWDGQDIGAGGGRFSGDELHVVATIDDDPFALRVVDADGRPLSSVRVLLEDPRIPGMTLFGLTDDSGECRLIGVPPHEVLVHLEHSSGARYGVRVDASTRAAELELDPSARIQVVTRDGDFPIEGALVSVINDTRISLTADVFSDASGLATIPALAPGPYLVQATRADCWRREATVEARSEGEPAVLQVRRLASLTLEVLTPSGIPVADLQVSLESVEFDTPVSRWAAEGLVPDTSLVSDLHGRVRAERIPRGDYRWRIERSGQALEGLVTALPGSKEPVRIVLPE